jgi:hypothetical protein
MDCAELRFVVSLIPKYETLIVKMQDQMLMFQRDSGKRESVGFDSRQTTKGFSMFNRDKLCPCQFHVHTSGIYSP